MSYIIANNTVVAETKENLKSGESVLVSALKSENALDANREWELVNAQRGTISNAKKWAKTEEAAMAPIATEINPGEYLI